MSLKNEAKMPDENNEIKRGYALVAGMASLVTVTVLIIVKSAAFLASGSTSVLASLIDSIVDAGASLINYAAIRYSLKPADEEHRHGHGKVEGLAAVFQAAFIFGAGIFLLFESVSRFTGEAVVTDHLLSIGVMALAIVMSIGLVMVQDFCLKHAPSLAVESEKAHYASDIFLNGGVIVILLVLFFGGPAWLDPVFALGVAVYLSRTAWKIASKGVDMLLDRELPDEDREEILKIVNANPEIVSVHDLRTRKAGMDIYIYFDVEIDAEMSLKKAHAVSLDVEHKILKKFPNAEIMIHKDPAGIPHKESRHKIAGVHD